MNDHLTPEGLSKWLAGDSTPEEDRHARECPQCSVELSAFQDALSHFRASTVNWADRERGGRVLDTASLRRGSQDVLMRRLRWLAAAAAIAVLAVAPVYKKSIERQQTAEAVQESVDAELLERINAHLSRTAPLSLQPLTELVSTTNSKSEGNR